MYNWQKAPKWSREGFKNYVDRGLMPGHFLLACLCNDLAKAMGHYSSPASGGNSYAELYRIVQFMYNELPNDTWGSTTKIIAYGENLRRMQDEMEVKHVISK